METHKQELWRYEHPQPCYRCKERKNLIVVHTKTQFDVTGGTITEKFQYCLDCDPSKESWEIPE